MVSETRLERHDAGIPASVAPPSVQPRASSPRADTSEAIIRADSVTIRYGDFAAVKDVTLDIPDRQVTAIIGPSGCGKSTFLRAMNRMNDFIPTMSLIGSLTYRGENIYAPKNDAVDLRRRIGMVFQKPNPFPKTIF